MIYTVLSAIMIIITDPRLNNTVRRLSLNRKTKQRAGIEVKLQE